MPIACTGLAGPQPTEVPGAAATAARAERTAIPTPQRPVTSAPAPAASPSVSGTSLPAATARPAVSPVTDEQTREVRSRLEAALASPELPGIESLLFQNVSVASADGGLQLPAAEAAQWLRERAGPGLRVRSAERSVLAVALQVPTSGWPSSPSAPTGNVLFTFHRFNPQGQQDEERGEWKVDVVSLS